MEPNVKGLEQIILKEKYTLIILGALLGWTCLAPNMWCLVPNGTGSTSTMWPLTLISSVMDRKLI